MQTANDVRGVGGPGRRPVLMSVYACGPEMGAEVGVGRELSRPAADHADRVGTRARSQPLGQPTTDS
ncbi:hypothetical protein SAMN04487915_10821 [Arthrobacter sp. ov118]|nr:hypothetical protein SAMN04487915_10821 [Arthrobacter sp. ov118]